LALTPRGWVIAVAGVLLVALPLVALCGVTIFTLRSDAARLPLERLQKTQATHLLRQAEWRNVACCDGGRFRI
jgi:hypothetical protein